ncbi:MAG TPA: hypothetical protein VGR11_15625 [Solirubrobacteraceae bacterium]|nr:hypothetical protein [Solirubrobacteraceae bacterium]
MSKHKWQTRPMERSRRLVSSRNSRLAKRAATDALMLVACRVAGGSTWHLYKRLMLAACVAGLGYGYLVSLDERRRRGAAA